MTAEPRAITPGELRARFNRREPIVIFDVRPDDQFDVCQIDAPPPGRVLHVPLRRMLDASGGAEAPDAVAAYARTHLREALPRDASIVAVCARGLTAQAVVAGLQQSGYAAELLAGGMQAWGEFYEVVPIDVGPPEGGHHTEDIRIFQVIRAARGCVSHVVASGREAIVIDPLRHVDRYLDFARDHRVRIVAVVDTHGHADHVSGGPQLARAAGTPYYLHPYDAIHPIDGVTGDLVFEYLRDGMRLTAGRTSVTAIHVPGHTLGNMALLLSRPGNDLLFCGDSLFITSIARPDLGGRADAWAPLHYRSLRRLLALDEDTLVLPGHFSGSAERHPSGGVTMPLGTIRAQNIGARHAAGTETDFVRFILSSLPAFPPEYADIKRVNVGLLQPSEERLAELELGQNRCAIASSRSGT